MNHIYKLVWNRARNMYMAVSETAKSHGKSGSISRAGRKTAAILLAVLALTAGAGTVSLAADNTAGSGDGVAFGTGSSAPKAENVAIGKGATIKYSNGASKSTGDVAVGSGAVIDNYASQGGSIAIGKNAIVNNMTGKQESLFALGQTKYHSGNWLGTLQIPNNPENVAGSIAIGDNTYARTGSVMIGSHNYRGLIGDQTVDTSKTNTYGININATTLGTNSFNQGAFSSVTGAYSIISGKYDGSGFSSYGVQNFGATITGSLNSIESATSSSKYSGIANSIVGTANRTSNSNGSLIFGAGNEVKNSITSIYAPSSGGDSAKTLQNNLMEAVKKSESGGATLVIGGGNTADYTQKTQILGVKNTVTGTENNISMYNMIDGFNNTVNGASHLYTIGTNNTITNAKNTILFGDNRKAEGVENSVIIGNADETAPITTEKKDTVILGHNANATIDGGVALGAGSVASVDQNAIGYDPATKKPSTVDSSTWKSTAAAVSVGDASKHMTRQITNVAAGKEDTDAVNVAQLKKAQIHYYSMNPKSDVATGTDSNYNNNGATGNDAIAIGPFASAKGQHSLALGYKAQTTHLEGKDSQDDNTAVGYNSQSGYRSTALGYNSKATGRYAVALGTDALANQDNSTAIGMNAQAEGKQATALGSLAKASGESATAVGEGAEALANYSSAVGLGAKVDKGATKGTALGYQAKVLADAENSMALGASSLVSRKNSIAIGMSAQVSGAQSVAIGQGATVSVENSVALGQGSEASGNLNDYNVMSLTIPNLGSSYNVSGGWPSGIVSVGNDKVVRTITNVAAGRVTPTSTDAVNGSELYAVAIEAAKHATVKAAANSRITVDNTGVNKGKGIEYTIGLNTDGLAKSTDGLTFAGDDGKSDNSKVISRKLNEQLNIVGGATDTVEANNIGVVKKDDNTLNIRLAKDITGLTSLQATTVTSGKVTVDGQYNVITGLSNTTWDKTKDYSKSTKAATEAQLHEAMTQAAADANDTHITAGDYVVGTITDKDGKTAQGVSIDVVDKTGKVGTVRITDVAKASDVGDVTNLNADIKNAEDKTTVVDAVNHVDNKVGNLDYSSTKYVTKGEDVTTSIGKLDEAIKNASEAAGKHTIVSTKDANLSVENIAKEGEAANYQISLNKDLNVDSVTAGKVTINADNKGTIGELTNKTWDAKNITSGQAATEDQLQAATKNAVNYDGDDSKTVTLRKDTTIQNVANTTIEEGSKNAVNAGTVYKETRVEKDGIFIRQANTAGQNITALDHQVAANTESIYNINNRVSNLDNRVNKVGAGAAALAALHPLDFNPDDKWDFAVGYGNYRNANSVALGAFYRPNENTMLSLGTNFGNGENMFNAGVSFKIGKGNSYAGYSKVEMAKVIDTQSREVAALKEENAKNAKDNAVMKAEIEALKKQVEALATKK
ncbi:ESPR-type extended signal peptide-containing protein [Dialister succinatiphilus]|jgi:hypothetical protein|uniref:ESPR-type extended signal peptide-containing protein n=1 Tax=Dialister succinatiphilus TaxID=487173 RepID=UPI0023542608|nr:ESPR-type extended signal peptide-containing protein [Dialister succinatiphilus]